jgi:exonuclease SbcC
LSEEQQQQLQQSLQALTDEEKTLLAQQQSQQKHFQWLTRHDELVREQQRVTAMQQQAQQALTDAAPELAKLQLAPPPSFAALGAPAGANRASGANQQRIIEVNTRLQAKTLRARIRNTALRTHEQLQTELTALAQWLAEHERYRLLGQEIAGWRAQFSQLNRDKTQLASLAARIGELRNRLAEMPENALTLTADEVSAAMEQQSRSRTLRQRLTSLHARYQPLQKRLRQSSESVQKAQANRQTQ